MTSESTEELARRVRSAGAVSPAAFRKVLSDALAPEVTLVHVPASDHDGPLASATIAAGWTAEFDALDRGVAGFHLDPFSVEVDGSELDIELGYAGTFPDGRALAAGLRMVLTVGDLGVERLVGQNDPAGVPATLEAMVAGGLELPPGFELAPPVTAAGGGLDA